MFRIRLFIFMMLLPVILMANNGYGAFAAAILLLLLVLILDVILVIAYLRKGKSVYFNIGLVLSLLVFLMGAQMVAANPDTYEPGESQFILIPNLLLLCLLFKKLLQKPLHFFWNALTTEFLLLLIFNGTYALGADYDDFMQYLNFLVFPCMTFWYTRKKLIQEEGLKVPRLVLKLAFVCVIQYLVLDVFAWYTDSPPDLVWDNLLANTDDLWKGSLAALLLGSAGVGLAVQSHD